MNKTNKSFFVSLAVVPKMLKGRGQVSSTIIDKLIVVLFNLLGEERKVSTRKPSSRESFSFEDRVSQKAYEHIRKYSVNVLPPRSTLNYPTVSGLKHQFDGIVMDGNTFYVIECKKRGIAFSSGISASFGTDL